MKKLILILSIGLLTVLPKTATPNPIDSSINVPLFIEYFDVEEFEIKESFKSEYFRISIRLQEVKDEIKKAKMSSDVAALVFALEEKMELKEQMQMQEEIKGLQLAKLRYKKGLALIKLLYEKTLGLDHHFSSLQTFHNVFQLTNPNSYPGFSQHREILKEKLKKKNAVKLPNFMGSNPYLTAAFSLVSIFSNESSQGQKTQDLDDIGCVLDFTVRMNNELNTIYYETEFLKSGNTALKEQISTLFEEYVKVIGYSNSLQKCRSSDDWETVFDKLDLFVRDLEEKKQKNDPLYDQMVFKGHVNLEFSVDRFLTFLEKYNDFISQGSKYYEKFTTIINNYENEQICSNKLPHQFSSLKKDIELSLSKFNEAYNIAELRGSKLKDLLYGLTE